MDPLACLLFHNSGGTYGIVWLVTVKTYPDIPVTTVRVLYEPSSLDTSSLDTHWEGIGTFFSKSPKYLNTDAYHITYFDNTLFHVVLFFPNKTLDEVTSLTQP